MQTFKITYTDETTQQVVAKRYVVDREWVTFYDTIGGQLHSAPAKDVKTISRDGVEDRSQPDIGFA